MAEREEGEEERPRQKREREDELERWQRRQAKLCCSLRSLGEKEQAVEPTMRLREKVKREVPSASREKKSENAKAEFEKEREKKNCISTNVFFFSPSKPEAESERASSAFSLARSLALRLLSSPYTSERHQRETPASLCLSLWTRSRTKTWRLLPRLKTMPRRRQATSPTRAWNPRCLCPTPRPSRSAEPSLTMPTSPSLRP